MSEYQERHSVPRLIGAPPGYVGYDESGQLTEAVRRKPYSIVLLDEIEKAHPDVFNILLQVLEDGRLTDNKGRVVDFKNTIIIMTSNLGAEVLQAQAADPSAVTPEQKAEAEQKVLAILKQSLRPEFLNRIDEIVIFEPLGKTELREIVKLQMAALERRLEDKNIRLQYDETLLDWLADKGYEPELGARPLKRAIQRYLTDPLSRLLIESALTTTTTIQISPLSDHLDFHLAK